MESILFFFTLSSRLGMCRLQPLQGWGWGLRLPIKRGSLGEPLFLGSVEYPFVAITPSFTLVQSGSTSYYPTNGRNRSFRKLLALHKNIWNHITKLFICTGWNDKILTLEKTTWFHFRLMKTGFLFLLQTIYKLASCIQIPRVIGAFYHVWKWHNVQLARSEMRRCTTHALYRSNLWQQDHCQHPQNANLDCHE